MNRRRDRCYRSSGCTRFPNLEKRKYARKTRKITSSTYFRVSTYCASQQHSNFLDLPFPGSRRTTEFHPRGSILAEQGDPSLGTHGRSLRNTYRFWWKSFRVPSWIQYMGRTQFRFQKHIPESDAGKLFCASVLSSTFRSSVTRFLFALPTSHN